MRITSSYVGMDSVRSYASVTQRATSFSLTSANLMEGELGNTSQSKKDKKDVKSTNEGDDETFYPGLSDRMTGTESIARANETEDKRPLESVRSQCVQFLIKWLYEALCRKHQRVQNPTEAFLFHPPTYELKAVSRTAAYYHKEEENTSFSTVGTVKCADGREISFGLNLSMSRSFEEYYGVKEDMLEIAMKDPLVINFDSTMANLSDQKFRFDIDADGNLDTISKLTAGSGYLALDLNGDGTINDGSELFGTKSGNGFKDLSAYDSDGNGWIDEGDEIWDKLLIWTQDENGKDQLYHLSQKGIGAICLQQASTDFSLNSLTTGQVNGQIRQTGIFLYENGNVGTMQNIDVAS